MIGGRNYSKKLCVTCSGSLDFNGGGGISYKGDNFTLSSTLPVLSVVFISSDMESMIHCQVSLLEEAHVVNHVAVLCLRFREREREREREGGGGGREGGRERKRGASAKRQAPLLSLPRTG